MTTDCRGRLPYVRRQPSYEYPNKLWILTHKLLIIRGLGVQLTCQTTQYDFKLKINYFQERYNVKIAQITIPQTYIS